MSISARPLPSSAARAQRLRLPAGMVAAVALHGAIIAAIVFSFTWSRSLDIADQTPMVPVDLVTLSDKTNVRATVKQEVKAPPKEDVVQPPAPEQAQATPSSPQPEEAAPPVEKAPAPEAKPVPPQPVTPPTPKPAPEKKKESFDIDKMMALLDKRAPAAAAAPNAKVAQRTQKGIGDQNMMTADLKSMLLSMVYKCWSPPVGAPNADDLVVSFRLFLKEDGTIAQPPQLVGNSGGDSYARAAQEAARRAIYTCQPYALPQDRYAQWRDVTFVFDPRQMVGQ